MTFTEALAFLHKAGRIRTPWLHGMLVGYADQHPGFTFRVDEKTPPIEEGRWAPVLNDPATRGCLLDLLREASRDPRLVVMPPASLGWYVFTAYEEIVAHGPTEGEALAAGLIALAVHLQDPRAPA